MDVSEAIYRCDRLIELLERDRDELAKGLEGDILEEYRKCLDLEILKMQEIRGKIRAAAGAL